MFTSWLYQSPLRHKQMILTSSEKENVLIGATLEKETSCFFKYLKELKHMWLVEHKQINKMKTNKIISYMNTFHAKGSRILEDLL